MIQALARVSSSHFAELLVLADPEVSKAIYRQEGGLCPCDSLITQHQMNYCWLCPMVQAIIPLAVFFSTWWSDIGTIVINLGAVYGSMPIDVSKHPASSSWAFNSLCLTRFSHTH